MRDPIARAKAWATMRRLETGFTALDIQTATEAPYKSCGYYILALHKAAYVELVVPRTGAAGYSTYRLARNTGPIAPYLIERVVDPNLANWLGDQRQQIWQQVRHQKSFTLSDIAATAEVHESKARPYLQLLAACGYLQPIPLPGKTGRPRSFYRLQWDTGLAAPIPHPDGGLFDPNTLETYLPLTPSTHPEEPCPTNPSPALATSTRQTCL
jgi:hypothetical protein